MVSTKGIFRVSDTARMRVNVKLKCDYGKENKKEKEGDESKSETISWKSSGYLGTNPRIQDEKLAGRESVTGGEIY